jgi:4-hydroxybenzoate decarboxylase subunit C
MHSDLQSFIKQLRKEKEIIEISTSIDSNLEAAEIHRRTIASGGPALLFLNIKGSGFPLATNLFGTSRRIELAFGPEPSRLVKELAQLPQTILPPSVKSIWNSRKLFFDLLKKGLVKSSASFVNQNILSSPKLMSLPLLKTWEQDGGEFITLPLVHTESPESKISNLGMYRMQRYDDSSTGMHMQIGKGGGFHLNQAKRLNKKLPVNVYIGGPPALILSAIAPLPENVPELLLASLVQGKKLPLIKTPYSEIPIIGSAEFALIGEVDPNELKAEGPFGDHYGYYSLMHDYPVFRCKTMLHRDKPICAATVVGKPKQEDFFLGDYLQELLSPIFPIVMPAVEDLWSYGETGYHSLTAAVVKQRYKREAMASAFRILGEGQLSLTKFLLLTDRNQDLRNFPKTLEYILERVDFRSDLYIFSNLAMDTLDYTGPQVNHGSKGVLLGVGEAIRDLPRIFSGEIPAGISGAQAFCGGCLVVQGSTYKEEPNFANRIANALAFKDWPLVILVDDLKKTLSSTSNFLWTTFTRFEPGADIYTANKEITRNHLSFQPPIVFDARMKTNYPDELECDQKTAQLVSQRWNEYFPDVLNRPQY